MAGRQVTIRLRSPLKAKFDAYTERLGVDGSELAKLLIVREQNLQRLRAGRDIKKLQRRPKGNADRLPTVTAHFSRIEAAEKFSIYAKSCGLSRSSAGAWLLEAELSERWLEAALHRE